MMRNGMEPVAWAAFAACAGGGICTARRVQPTHQLLTAKKNLQLSLPLTETHAHTNTLTHKNMDEKYARKISVFPYEMFGSEM